jgi:hypothetical protein
MADCRIERTIANVGQALNRAKTETLARGGSFEGDLERGTYVMRTPLGPIEGTYSATGSSVAFVVTRKPALVPCALIARVIDQFLG